MKADPGVMYRFLRAARRAPERMLHTTRHRRIVQRLAARPKTNSVLVMCYGNICRSPFAAARLQHMLAPLGVRVSSAGLFGSNRETPAEGREAARSRGVDLFEHRSRLVTAELVLAADLVIVMDSMQSHAILKQFGGRPSQIVFLGDLDPEPINTRRIHDPERQSVTVFAEVYDRIERCAATMARALGAVPR